MKGRCFVVALAAASLVVVGPVATSTAGSPAKRTHTLKMKNRKLSLQRARLIGKLRERTALIEHLRIDLSNAREELRVASRGAERTDELESVLAQGLKEQIAAVPMSNFLDEVLRPAYFAYPVGCRNFASIPGSWSYTFYSLNLC